MKRLVIVLVGCLTALVARHPVPVLAQATASRSAAPRPGDWPLHNLDVRNGRYSPLDQINASTAQALALKWSFDLPQGETAASETPVVVDGVMYFNSGSKLFAVDAATGRQKWMSSVQPTFNGGGRGPAYGDGRIYAFGRTMLYAVDAKTGKAVESFGEKGVLRIINRALEFKDPEKYPADLDPTTLGYSMTTPPTYYNGMIYVGIPFSDSLISGGLLVAADGRTGAIKWVFRTVPQNPQDDGWEIAKDSWKGAHRSGGGIWTSPAIDPELGIIYANVGNPTPNYDASSRLGANLFTNSLVALNLATGKLLWHFQAIHHDIWDFDLVTGPTLFDVEVGGRTVKAVATLPKNCYAYILNRENGQPINPIVETAVPTKTDVPGEEPWPTQPIPYTSRGTPQPPFCSVYPKVTDPELAARVRPAFTPYQAGEFIISAPGNQGGPNYGPPSFSPRTGLFYVTGKNDAYSIKAKVIGEKLPAAGPGNLGHFGLIAEVGKTGITPSQNIAAYEPGTGNLAWVVEVPGITGTGNLVTAGDVLVQAVGKDFYALDAHSGTLLFKTAMTSATRSTPMTYLAGGKQFVAIVSGSSVIAFGLP